MEEFQKLIDRMEEKVRILADARSKALEERDKANTEYQHADHLHHWAAKALDGLKDYKTALDALNSGAAVPNPEHPF